ncbi:MAG: type II toxin-antitoxin system HicB family antitoxin [Candidatus Omnitrophica bacterium]|nr:type II toxin-antitoxin system HicB family antitoxin [Candidatus Omnitrophota bacterium]
MSFPTDFTDNLYWNTGLCYSLVVMKRIEFTSLIFRENETFVSFCPELSVASCGDTVDDARRRLKEAVRLFIEESDRMGTLEDILTEEGFIRSGSEWISPPLIATEHCEVSF